MPATPSALSTSAAMRPATNVPWPIASSAEPPTKLFAVMTLFVRSGCPRSMPVSMTPTVTGSSSGSSAQKSNARTYARCHWRAASGSSTKNCRASPRVEASGAASTNAWRRTADTGTRSGDETTPSPAVRRYCVVPSGTTSSANERSAASSIERPPPHGWPADFSSDGLIGPFTARAVPVSVTGDPAAAMPAGRDSDSTPIVTHVERRSSARRNVLDGTRRSPCLRLDDDLLRPAGDGNRA